MKPESLEFGDRYELRCEAQINLDQLKPGEECHVWLDKGTQQILLDQGKTPVSLKGLSQTDHKCLVDLCATNLPHITWLATVKDKQALVMWHRFPALSLQFHTLQIAVDEQVFDQARRCYPKITDIRDAIEWLSNQCLLPSNLQEHKYAFLSAGGSNMPTTASAFLLHGRSIQVSIKKKQRVRDEVVEEYMSIEKIIRQRRCDDTIFLATGIISFSDESATAQMRASVEAELSSLTVRAESYLKIWRKFGDLENKIKSERAQSIGAFEYDNWQAVGQGQLQFDLFASPPDELQQDDDLEAALEAPASLRPEYNDEALPFAPSSPGHRNFRGSLVKAGDRSVVLKGKDDDTPHPPVKGVLYLSTRGDETIQRRRQMAINAITTGSCPMPQLGLLLEGQPVPIARHTTCPPLSPIVQRKVFPKHPPTDRQKEAIKLALNTPDIVLIQGPPGTGKTTVITAIIERINEITDTSEGVPGEILITGYQHDAVDNLRARLLVNDLPPIKFGNRPGQSAEEANEYDVELERWIQEKSSTLRQKLPPLEGSQAHKQVTDLLEGYLLAPGDATATHKCLQRLKESVKDQIPHGLLGRLDDLLRELSSTPLEDHLPTQSLRRSIRAVRVQETAFRDDGPRNARHAFKQLNEKGLLDEKSNALLQHAYRWHPDDGSPNFLDQLRNWRREMLLTLIPEPLLTRTTVRKDVLDLLGDIRDSLQSEYLQSADAADRAGIEFLEALEHQPGVVREAIQTYTTVYAATCQQSAGRQISEAKSKKVAYESVLIDEAARSAPLDLLIPMSQARGKIILVGDHRQLPHIVDRELEHHIDIGIIGDDESIKGKVNQVIHESLFFNLFREMQALGESRTITLDEQFRMHPLLGNFVSEQFYAPYGEGFRSPLPAELFAHGLPGYEGTSLAWLNVPTSAGPERTENKSKLRVPEAKVIAQEVARLIDTPEAKSFNFGIIAPYTAQIKELKKQLKEYGLMVPQGNDYTIAQRYQYLELDDHKKLERLRVGTVDSFQGKEFDVVFLSMVRSNQHPDQTERDKLKKYGHLMSPNRLCVSMSRQKKLLVVVGDRDMLEAPHAVDAIGPLKAYYLLCRTEGIIREGIIR